jgi:hypothetical protein
MHELRARGRSTEVEELTAAASSSHNAFSGHYFLRVDERLQCNVCKAEKTTLKCANCGVYVCNPGTGGRQCLLRHLADVLAGAAEGPVKRKHSEELTS